MKGEIIAVGTEILLGDIVNTNAQYISQECASIGLNIFYHTAVGDNPSRLASIFPNSLNRSDIVIITGGLGPTKDDLTKEIIAKALQLPLVLNWQWFSTVKRLFTKRDIAMPRNNIKQALIPKGAEILPNKNGTACGIYIKAQGKHIFLLPGPPREMKPMFKEQVLDKLLEQELNKIHSKVVKTRGIGESALVEVIDDLITDQTDPTIATLAKNDGIHVRITTNSPKEKIDKTLAIVEDRLNEYIWGYDEDALNELIIKKLREKGMNISTVESCTGGAIASILSEVPGSSSSFYQGNVLYTEQAKADFLNCPISEIPGGAIDEKLTITLAQRSKELLSTGVAFAITGALGPTAPEGVDIGTVYMAVAIGDKVISKEFKFYGSRENIKDRAITQALHLIYENLNGDNSNG